MSEEYESFSVEALVARLEGERLSGPLLFAWSCNVFQPEDELRLRIGVFRIGDEQPPELLLDGILPREALEECKATLAERFEAVAGRWDPVWLGGWSLVWTEGSEAFRLWNTEGLQARLDPGGDLRVRETTIPRKDIGSVDRFATSDWVTRGVRVTRKSAEPFVVASEENAVPTEGYMYDGLNLSSETIWALALANELSRRLDKPFVDALF